jgi:mono/diheme cytochrome c family protein
MMNRLVLVVGAMSALTIASVRPSAAGARAGAPGSGVRARTVTGASAPRQEPDGKELYEDNCRKCHGVRGVPPKAIKEKFPKVQTLDEAFLAKVNDDSLIRVMKNGVGKAEDMKSFTGKLTPVEMAAVAKYVRSIAVKKS